MTQKSIRLVPLGGLGEVGKNMLSVEYGGNILIIDAGIMFPENDMLGIDYIIPDFEYLRDKKDKVRGIIVTHGHEDHTGAISHLLEEIKAPIYATALTCGLLEVKLNRRRMLDDADLNVVKAGDTIQLGPFGIEFFHVCHSIPDAVGLGITTPAGLIVHSGDYKFDYTPVDGWPTDFGKLAELGGRGVLALLGDSTNALEPSWTPSETVVDGALDQVFRQAEGRILIGSFASLISRMAQVGKAAANHGRSLSFVGTSMIENAKMARKLGYLDLPESLIVPLEQALEMKPSKVVLMCTGTQGEPSSILGRLSKGMNRQFNIEPGDTVVLSSHPIPGNEETVHRTINGLLQRGAEVIYDEIAPVHVSGHASQEEIKLLIKLIQPQYLIPIHGELRHLKRHAALAEEMGIPKDRIAVVENGTVIELQKEKLQIGKRIPGGYVFVDGSGVGDIGPKVLRERESLARDGFVAIQIQRHSKTGALQGQPQIRSKGFVFAPEAQELFAQAEQRIGELLAEHENGSLEARLEKELAKFFYTETRRRPMLFVFITDVK